MLDPDEPRYAAIGQEMARSGDCVTPRLWGQPWFEKPPLLYWMTAVANRAGLGPDLAPRLPVATVGFAFLLFFYWFVHREFGSSEAFYSTAILATSPGWIAFSLVAVTDIPMSATFCAALLLVLAPGARRAAISGVLLGLAVLAKGLVPLVLFAPAVWILRRRIREAVILGAVCVLVAAPWYLAVTLQNGQAFIDEFIWKHHFQRFTSDALQHVRPWWFYIPVLLGAVFPWTPAAALIRGRLFEDHRLKFLALWTAFALLFFSISRNKLPGYILPLVPVVSLLLGTAIARVAKIRISLPVVAVLTGVVPIAAGVLPLALAVGLSRSRFPAIDWFWIVAGVFAAGVCVILEIQDRRSDAVLLIAMALGIGLFRSKTVVLPILDRVVSVRPFYLRHASRISETCLQGVGRAETYGLQYYTGRLLPVCGDPGARPRVVESGQRLLWID